MPPPFTHLHAYDLDLWPLTLKNFSVIPIHMMTICATNYWNPSTKYTDIASHEIGVNGRTAWWTTGRRNAPPHTGGEGIKFLSGRIWCRKDVCLCLRLANWINSVRKEIGWESICDAKFKYLINSGVLRRQAAAPPPPPPLWATDQRRHCQIFIVLL